MATFSQVVRVSMNHKSSANNVVRSLQLNLFVGDVDFSNSIRTSFNVTQITYMTNRVSWTSVLLTQGIEMRSGTGATIGVVAELVNVESVQTLLQAGHLAGDLDGIAGLLEEQSSLAVALKNAYGLGHFFCNLRIKDAGRNEEMQLLGG